jgi:hypothetical protein
MFPFSTSFNWSKNINLGSKNGISKPKLDALSIGELVIFILMQFLMLIFQFLCDKFVFIDMKDEN